MNNENINENKIIDNIRGLVTDIVYNAKSGHLGIGLGATTIMYTLFAHHLNFDPKNPDYFNRDRFILSAGHGSSLLYSILFLAGYDISLDDLKNFRKIDSITPGHPEYKVTPGVEMTTGVLGQGIATSVGLAMAERYLNNLINQYKKDLINHYTYVLVSDGDLMEGISYEALSLAGLYKLNKLIVLYDSNNITLDNTKEKSSNENLTLRFNSIGWNVIEVEDGDNIAAISKAIDEAKSSDKPTIIEVKTIIGKYLPNEATSIAHGYIPTEEDVEKLKEKLNIRNIPFSISQNIIDDFQSLVNERCSKLSNNFNKQVDSNDEIKKLIDYLKSEDKSIDIKNIEYYPPEDMLEEPRKTSGKILNSISKNSPFIIGGSADLFSSNCTYVEEGGDFSSENYGGKNIFYGVREQAMGAITNGLALHGLRPYASTFMVFSDFLKPSLRLACMMKLPTIYIFSHDSITIGEDGPTHQPIEHLSALRTIPNLDVYRPADVNEVIGTYKCILNKKDSPAAILLSKNKLPILKETNAISVEKGGYIVKDFISNKNLILISSGEELSLTLEIADELSLKGYDIRVVSIPNQKRFFENSKEYIEEILPVEVKKVAIEASLTINWENIIYNKENIIGINEYGASGNKDEIKNKYGFTKENIIKKIEKLLN